MDGVPLAATTEPVADLDTLDPEEAGLGFDTPDPVLEPGTVVLPGTEVNETGLGVGVALKEGVKPPRKI